MPDVSADLRRCLADSFGTLGTCTLPGGAVVVCRSSVATNDDALGGDSIIAGRTRVLRITAADAPNLKDGDTGLLWNSITWRVNKLELAAGGFLLLVFLGTP